MPLTNDKQFVLSLGGGPLILIQNWYKNWVTSLQHHNAMYNSKMSLARGSDSLDFHTHSN